MTPRRRHRAIQITKISGELVHLRPDGGANLLLAVDLPPVEWIVTGPRGGRYAATGERHRLVYQDPLDAITGEWSIVDTSEDTRYIRPVRP
jgi:hypothetical protein